MLIGNYSVLNKSPGRFFGGTLVGGGADRANYGKNGAMQCRFFSDPYDPLSGTPDGYRPPYCWQLPLKAGAIAARNQVGGTGTLAVPAYGLAEGRALVGALTGTGSLSATGKLIVQAAAALAGSGSITTAGLVAILQAVAALEGSGALAADVDAYGFMLSALAGTGVLSAPPYATGALEADISPFTELSPESLAASVWNAIAASYDAAGTMGEKMNDAGSAANPWTEEIETGYTAEELLRLIAASLLGKLDGATTTTITMRDVNDTIDRIVATVDGDGNRDSITLDPS